MGRYSPQTPSAPHGTEHPRCGYSVPCGLIITTRREVLFIAIYHCTIKIIKRSEGRSAVAAAAYRSGQKLTNEWDGQTHDYTRKGGIVHSEILLPAHAPPAFQDRATLWNSVEEIEKSGKAQLAREIEIALPVELDRAAQLALVRAYVRDNFVTAGMCADFALHDKSDGNPHAHIMLTMRPLEQSGEWGAKCRKEYDLDPRGQRIPDGKGGWKNHRADTTDWNEKDKAEQWRAAWAEYANRALEQTGRPERIDHRSYKRQGVEQLPTVHMGVAATRMEQRGISTDKGNVNRQIATDNKLLKEIKARVTRLYNWSKERAAKPQGKESVMAQLWQARQEMSRPTTRTGKVKALKESAALFNFLQTNGITSMRELHEKVAAMNGAYYDLRGDIRTTERRLAALTERLEMWTQYEQHKGTRRQLDGMKPAKREKFAERHGAELALFDTAAQFLGGLKATGEAVTPKQWQAEADTLTAKKDVLYSQMRAMREEVKAVEQLRKAAEQLAKTEQSRRKEQER